LLQCAWVRVGVGARVRATASVRVGLRDRVSVGAALLVALRLGCG
jgi:hypothetical protein